MLTIFVLLGTEKRKPLPLRVMDERDADGKLSVCIPAQVLIEFISAVTSQRVEKPLTIAQATSVVKKYLDSDEELGQTPDLERLKNVKPILAIAKIKVINFAGLDKSLDIIYYEIYCRYWEAVKICQQLLTAISV